MSIIWVNKLKMEKDYPDLVEVSARLDSLKQDEKIDRLNWPDYNYRPDVKFRMAYTGREIFIKYYVKEEYVKAEMDKTNQMVCEDSCVEFFVSPADDGIYYNFEFNSIGTCLLGSGTGRHNSKLADKKLAERIRTLSSLGKETFQERKGDQEWTLTVAIPLELFFRHRVSNLEGKEFRANFYKCGDRLSRPHYITWNPVGTVEPDYHQPGYFGLMKFV